MLHFFPWFFFIKNNILSYSKAVKCCIFFSWIFLKCEYHFCELNNRKMLHFWYSAFHFPFLIHLTPIQWRNAAQRYNFFFLLFFFLYVVYLYFMLLISYFYFFVLFLYDWKKCKILIFKLFKRWYLWKI